MPIRMPSLRLPAVVAALLIVPAGSALADAPDGLHEYVGGMHGHSAYSDGYTGSRPADADANAKRHGNDFFAMSDHSDTLDVPISASQYCIDQNEYPGIAQSCAISDQTNPADSFRKYPATEEQAEAATDASFTGIRGFEWT